jgi:hypothetical protein
LGCTWWSEPRTGPLIPRLWVEAALVATGREGTRRTAYRGFGGFPANAVGLRVGAGGVWSPRRSSGRQGADVGGVDVGGVDVVGVSVVMDVLVGVVGGVVVGGVVVGGVVGGWSAS